MMTYCFGLFGSIHRRVCEVGVACAVLCCGGLGYVCFDYWTFEDCCWNGCEARGPAHTLYPIYVAMRQVWWRCGRRGGLGLLGLEKESGAVVKMHNTT